MQAPFTKEVLAAGTAAVLEADSPKIRVSKDSGPIVLQTSGLAGAEEIDILVQHMDESTYIPLLDDSLAAIKFTATSDTRIVLTDPGVYKVAKDITVAAVGVTKVVSRAGD